MIVTVQNVEKFKRWKVITATLIQMSGHSFISVQLNLNSVQLLPATHNYALLTLLLTVCDVGSIYLLHATNAHTCWDSYPYDVLLTQ